MGAVREILYETNYHASGSFSHLDLPEHQVNEDGKGGLFSSFLNRGIVQLKEKFYKSKNAEILKKGILLFVSPRGDHVAVVAGNQITFLQKDDKYMDSCGTFMSNDKLTTFTYGAWSDSCGLLGVTDRNTLYLIKSNGEELFRVTRSQLKTSAQCIGLFVQDDRHLKTSCLCIFNVLTSDGLLHCIEVTQENTVFVSHISAMNNQSARAKQYPKNISCLDFHPGLSLLVLVGGVAVLPENQRDNAGTYCLSLWRVASNSDLEQLFVSPHFEGLFSIPKGHIGPFTTPKVEVSAHGKHVAVLDMAGCLDVFNLDTKISSLSLVALGSGYDSKNANTSFLRKGNCMSDIVDFTWWSDHTLITAKRSGIITMVDVPSGIKLLENDPIFSMPVLGRMLLHEECVFVLESSLSSEESQETKKVDGLDWNLVSFSERSVSEMYKIFLGNQQYQLACDLVNKHGLDKDEVFKAQWLNSDNGIDAINRFLSKIQDQNFVISECVKKIGPTEDAVKALLSYGLHITDRYRFEEPEDGQCWDFRLVRLQLLQYKDRLETFMGINMGRFSKHNYSKFRISPLNEAATALAEGGKIGALNLLFKRHAYSLSPFILDILAAIPETVTVRTYGQLLPGPSPPSSIALRERDWVEGEKMLSFVDNHQHSGEHRSNIPVKTEHIVKHYSGFVWPSIMELSQWYKNRAREMDRLSGQLENCLSLVEFACQIGIVELQRFYEDISFLNQIVYLDLSTEEINCDISLVAWEQLSDYEKFKMMLKGVREDTVLGRLREIAIPFMHQRFSEVQVERGQLSTGFSPVDSFLVRWLKEIAAENKLEVCLTVLEEGCRGFLVGGLFKDEMEAIEVSLSCLYLCNLTDRWNMMASIFSKLPPVYSRGKSSVADRDFSPRYGIRGFGFPRNSDRIDQLSTSNTEANVVNLNEGDMSLEKLEKRVKLAEGHVEAGRILAYYQVAKPMRFFLEAHSDEKGVKQMLRLILSKFGRRQPSRSDNDWANMWQDMQCLQEKAFPFLGIEYVLIEFCRGLLKAGKFSLARNYLKGTGSIALATEKAESLVIQAAREYFFSASSLDCSEIWKARECLNLLPNSRNIKAEAGIIDALTTKLPSLGVTLLPMQFRQIRSPMEIINMVITSQTGAYANVDELIEIAKLFGLSSQDDIAAIQETVAREATVTGDLQLAFDLCLVLVKKGHGPIWDLCAAIARGPVLDNMDINSRKKLLGFALSHCDEESVGELLHAWKDLDIQSQCEKLVLSTGTKPPNVSIEGSSIISFPIHGIQEILSDEESLFESIKEILSSVARNKDGTSWDSLLKENGNFLSFAALQLPWLYDLSKKPEYSERTKSTCGKPDISVRFRAVMCIISWLAMNDIAPSDDLVTSIAKATMEAPVTEEDDVLACSYLLNLKDAFQGVEVLQEQMSIRKGYQESCSIMNIGMAYSSLHNSGSECASPGQRRKLLLEKFQEKQALFGSDVMDKIDKVQSTFWREWKSKLGEQKRLADQTRELEQTIPGLEVTRFLSGDLNYIQNSVLSFIDSVKLEKKHILQNALKLADAYGLNRSEVLLRYLGSVLVSEIWTNDDIEAEISDHKQELLDCAMGVIDMISSTVYDVIDGHDKQRLAYVYNILSECYSKLSGIGEPTLMPETDDGHGRTIQLSQVYKVLEQECRRVSFIKNLNFKNIAGLGGLNLEHFSEEVFIHVDEFNLEALAQMVQTLVGIYKNAEVKGLVSLQAVYKHYVLSLLTALENEIKTKDELVYPNDFGSLLGEVERNYGHCRMYIKTMPETDMLDILARCYKLSLPHEFWENLSGETAWMECLILLLNLWVKLANDILEIIHDNNGENPHLETLSKWLTIFMNLIEEGRVSPNQGGNTISYFVENGFFGIFKADISSYCKAMIFCGCGFSSIDEVLSADIFRDSDGIRNLASFYVNMVDTLLVDVGVGSGTGQQLHNLLSSLSNVEEGNIDGLQKTRFAVWGRLSTFAENMEQPNQIRVYSLELLQSITGRSNISGVQPWDEWDDPLCSVNTEASPGSRKPAISNRFTSTLVALKSTELISTICPTVEISPDDLANVDSAVTCFLRLAEEAVTESHFNTLKAITEEWEGLFICRKTEEPSKESDSTGNNWNNDGWDEGWDDDFHEELVEKEEKEEGSVSVHSLHVCWMEIIKKFVRISQFTEVIKLIDRSLANNKGILLSFDEAKSLSQLLLNIDCFVALKIMLLLPYEEIWFQCLTEVEAKLKLRGVSDTTSGDDEIFMLILSSGVISTITKDSTFISVFSFLCYLSGNFCRIYQENQLSSLKFSGADGNRRVSLFVRILFPCFVSELVKAKHYLVAGFLVSRIMHTHASLSLINFAEVALRRYCEGQINRLRREDDHGYEEIKCCECLVNTVSGLRKKLVRLLQSALSTLSNDMK